MTTSNALSLAVIAAISLLLNSCGTEQATNSPGQEASDRMARLELLHASGLIAQSEIDDQRRTDAAGR